MAKVGPIPKVDDWITENGLILIRGWARDGLSNKQIAHNMGVAYSTFHTWKSKYEEISDALKKGKEVSDYEVENALYKRAIGYDIEIERTLPTGEVVSETKHVEPNVTAQIFWLKNRKPEQWNEKYNVEHNGNITNNNIDLSGITTEELRILAGKKAKEE